MHDARVERLGKRGKSSDSCALCAKGHKEGELKSSSGDGCQMISFWSYKEQKFINYICMINFIRYRLSTKII